MRKGELKKYGYSTKISETHRHLALTSAARAYGPLSVFRKLNALMVLNKNRSPTSSKVFKDDRDWVKDIFMDT